MPETRQQRRARERAEAKRSFDALHGRVLGSRSIQEMWRTFRGGLFAGDLPPGGEAILERTFYAGAAAMFELTTRVALDSVDEDAGVRMLERLHEELDEFSKRSTGGMRS